MNRILIAGAAFLAVLVVPALAAGDSIFGGGKSDAPALVRSGTGEDTTSTLPELATEPAATDDEVEVKGRITSLSPLSVRAGARTITCSTEPGGSLAGFAVGDFVEITCDLRGGTWVVRVLKHEDDETRGADDDSNGQVDDLDDRGANEDDDEDVQDNSGLGNRADDDGEHEDSSGPGSDHESDDDSGARGGDDDSRDDTDD